jgi:hypothetical protein
MSDDVFADAFALLGAAANVKEFEARITRLKKLSEQVAAEQVQLAADREAHAREVAEAKAALDRRQTRLTEGEVELRLRRNAFDQREARNGAATSAEDRYPPNPNLPAGSSWRGLTREHHHE